MTTSNINLGEGMLFYWDSIWNQMDQNELILFELSQSETDDEVDFSDRMKSILQLFPLEKDLNHQMYYPFKYCFFNVEELNTELTITCQEIALTIFNEPFSYFSQDPEEFLKRLE